MTQGQTKFTMRAVLKVGNILVLLNQTALFYFADALPDIYYFWHIRMIRYIKNNYFVTSGKDWI